MAEKRGRGQPIKFTPEVGATILNYVRAGSYVETAARAAGVPKSTFYHWLTLANKPRAPKELRDFLDALEQAQAVAELRDVGVIDKAAQGGQVIKHVTTTKEGPNGQPVVREEKVLTLPAWQAAAWRLERKFPDRYGLQRQIDLRVKQEVEVWLNELERKLDPEVYAQVLEAFTDEEGDEGAPGEG